MQKLTIQTKLGLFTAWFSESGLARLEFPKNGAHSCQSGTSELPSVRAREWASLLETALDQTLSGKTPTVLPPLDLAAGTPFQQRVWKALQRIPAGQTRSYSQIGKMIRKPRATRAVGSACGANPIPVLIPCHRVLRRGGGLGGFSAGLPWKTRLLACEGVQTNGHGS